MSQQHVARVYVQGRTRDGELIVAFPGTNYQLHLRCAAEAKPSPQGRLRGVIACDAWKLDAVSAGGAYIEPVYGRPRRVQGQVIGSLAGNRVVVDVAGQPIVARLPQRWKAAELAEGTRIGLDVYDGASFEPIDSDRPETDDAASRFEPVNLRPVF